jgi:hypothetical protein
MRTTPFPCQLLVSTGTRPSQDPLRHLGDCTYLFHQTLNAQSNFNKRKNMDSLPIAARRYTGRGKQPILLAEVEQHFPTIPRVPTPGVRAIDFGTCTSSIVEGMLCTRDRMRSCKGPHVRVKPVNARQFQGPNAQTRRAYVFIRQLARLDCHKGTKTPVCWLHHMGVQHRLRLRHVVAGLDSRLPQGVLPVKCVRNTKHARPGPARSLRSYHWKDGPALCAHFSAGGCTHRSPLLSSALVLENMH